MPQVIENSEDVMIADDTNTFGGGISSCPALSSDFVKTQNWFDNNKLTINVEKCFTVNFGSGNRFTAVFACKTTKVMDSFKYLAVFIDKNCLLASMLSMFITF